MIYNGHATLSAQCHVTQSANHASHDNVSKLLHQIQA